MTNNPIGWFEIYVKDITKACAFYEAVLAVKLNALEAPDSSLAMWAFPMDHSKPGASGALVRMPGEQPSGNGDDRLFHVRRLRGRGEQGPGQRRKDHERQVLHRPLRIRSAGL